MNLSFLIEWTIERMTTTLFIPTLNESQAMRVILPQIKREWVDQILVVDFSTDDTADEPARIGGERKLQIVRWGGAYMTQVFRELYYWR